ncbi:MAG: permease [Bdellovibrionales bacterium]|nr:permease [Bdellovibrionales bacterium]
MNTLALACLALIAGPLLYQLISQSSRALKAIDGFVFVSIGGLLLLHLLEESGHEVQIASLALLLLGFLGPLLLEKFFRRLENEVHIATMLLGAFGFLIHTALDGTALALDDGHPELGANLSLATAIIVHRLPVGLTLWWLLKPRFGGLAAVLSLALAVAATIGGYSLAGVTVFESFEYTFPWVQAFVAGSILHVVFFRFHLHHSHEHSHHEGMEKIDVDKHAAHFVEAPLTNSLISSEGFGNLLGLGLLLILAFVIPHDHEGDLVGPIWRSFSFLAFESAPALLIAYVAGIFIYGFFPESSIRWMRSGGSLLQAGKGMLVGLPLPICSCGVLPYYQTLVKKGAPPAAAIAFLIATPELGIDAILLSVPLLGLELTVIRLIASAVIAFVVAWILSHTMKARRSLPILEEGKGGSAFEKIKRGMQFALVELVDTTAPWMLLGLLLAAVAGPLVESVGSTLPPLIEVLVFSCLGLVVYVCASGATPLVAALLAAGISPGAGLAFLLTGPATNISTFGVLSELHGKRLALAFGGLMMLCAILVGYLTNMMLPNYASMLPLAEEAAHHGHHEVPVWRVIAVSVVGLLFLSSCLRQGGRKFFGHVLGDQFGH